MFLSQCAFVKTELFFFLDEVVRILAVASFFFLLFGGNLEVLPVEFLLGCE